jgi:hypothetical protein
VGDSWSSDTGQRIDADGKVSYDFSNVHIAAAGIDLTATEGNPTELPRDRVVQWLRADGAWVAEVGGRNQGGGKAVLRARNPDNVNSGTYLEVDGELGEIAVAARISGATGQGLRRVLWNSAGNTDFKRSNIIHVNNDGPAVDVGLPNFAVFDVIDKGNPLEAFFLALPQIAFPRTYLIGGSVIVRADSANWTRIDGRFYVEDGGGVRKFTSGQGIAQSHSTLGDGGWVTLTIPPQPVFVEASAAYFVLLEAAGMGSFGAEYHSGGRFNHIYAVEI